MRQETKYTLIVTTRSHLQRKRFCNRHSNSCSHRCCVLNTINSDHRVTYSDVLHRCRCKPAIGSGTDDRGRQRRMSRLRKARPSAPSCSTSQWFLPMAKLMVLQCACIFGAMPLPSRAREGPPCQVTAAVHLVPNTVRSPHYEELPHTLTRFSQQVCTCQCRGQ